MPAITYVKADELSVGIGASVGLEIDLGLGIEEAAKIVGVELEVVEDPATASGSCRCAISFDPEDAAFNGTDDEQFVSLVAAIDVVGAAYSTVQTIGRFFDFSGLNLITTRNLALVATGVTSAYVVYSKIYYEKYKPTANELVQLIATRR